jgi:hypothetical protein
MGRAGELHKRWLVTTAERLVGSFTVVKVDLRLVDLQRADQVTGWIDQLAFILKISVITFDERVLVRSLRWADLWVDPQTLEKT